MLTATNPLLCNMTVTLLWKCNELIVTQQELLRYYSNATTDLTCHNNNNNNNNYYYYYNYNEQTELNWTELNLTIISNAVHFWQKVSQLDKHIYTNYNKNKNFWEKHLLFLKTFHLNTEANRNYKSIIVLKLVIYPCA
jgi:hypothetical protein